MEAANIGTLLRMHTYAHTHTVSNAPICSLFLINLSLRKLERAPSQTNLTTPPSPTPNPQPPPSLSVPNPPLIPAQPGSHQHLGRRGSLSDLRHVARGLSSGGRAARLGRISASLRRRPCRCRTSPPRTCISCCRRLGCGLGRPRRRVRSRLGLCFACILSIGFACIACGCIGFELFACIGFGCIGFACMGIACIGFARIAFACVRRGLGSLFRLLPRLRATLWLASRCWCRPRLRARCPGLACRRYDGRRDGGRGEREKGRRGGERVGEDWSTDCGQRILLSVCRE